MYRKENKSITEVYQEVCFFHLLSSILSFFAFVVLCVDMKVSVNSFGDQIIFFFVGCHAFPRSSRFA